MSRQSSNLAFDDDLTKERNILTNQYHIQKRPVKVDEWKSVLIGLANVWFLLKSFLNLFMNLFRFILQFKEKFQYHRRVQASIGKSRRND